MTLTYSLCCKYSQPSTLKCVTAPATCRRGKTCTEQRKLQLPPQRKLAFKTWALVGIDLLKGVQLWSFFPMICSFFKLGADLFNNCHSHLDKCTCGNLKIHSFKLWVPSAHQHLLGAWEAPGWVNKLPPTNISALKQFLCKWRRQTDEKSPMQKAEQ